MERYKVIVPKLNVRKAPVADFNDKSNIITTVSDGLVLDLEEYHNVPNPGLGKWYTDGKGQFYSGLGLVGEDLKVNKLVSLKYPWWIDNNLYSIPELWKENEKTKVTIALLDTGISEHEDFNFNNIIGYNYLDNSANYKTDINGHGTHLAGIMIAQGKKTYGVAPNANLFVAKVCDDSGTPNIKAVKNALLDIYNSKNGASGISIINMSFGLKTINEDEYKIKLEIESLLRQIYIEKKIILISSSGKIDDKKDSFPSTLNECISVGCLNSKFERHPFSRITKTLDIMAPGDEILSSNGINNVKKDSGTSQAAAYISSVCALILQRQKILITDPEFVKKSLFASAYSNSFPLEEYGHGIVNPNKFYTDLKN
ncbi:S8 family serine peptidase [Flavobacterium sp.]|uniref:S8 family peptidase n=1 Tax=Flavobacterium sp. TaxID=239 RepID=UPI0031E12EAD